MARKFITEREVNFINRINHELIQQVVGQELFYYQILPEQTRSNSLYNEAIKKTWAPPVRINGLMQWDNSLTTFSNITADSKYSLDVYFHTQELQERNVLPKEGDFVEFGHVFFEITSVTQPQIVFGQINNRIMTKCSCVPSREGQFQAGNNSSENVDHTHQVENSKVTNR